MTRQALELMFYGSLGLAGLYVAAWIITRAFFNNKADYHRRLLRQLEEHSHEDEK